MLKELAYKYGCDFESTACEPSEGTGQRRPIAWFGAMVPPALRNAERDFAQVLDVVVLLTNVQRKLVRQVDSYHAAAKV
jgi:hypothetical protein